MKRITPIFLFLFLTSCTSVRYIDIEYYDYSPKQHRMQGDILVLMNLHKRDTGNLVGLLDWSMDSLASEEACNALVNMLNQSPWYENSTFLKQTIIRSDTLKVILPLSWDTIEQLSVSNSNQWVVSLEYLKIRPRCDTYARWRGDFKEFYGYIDVSIYAYWRVYDLLNRKISLGHLHTDTLSWEHTDWIEVVPGNQLPGVFEAAAYAGADAGERFAQLLAPQWQKDSRVLFAQSTDCEMMRAYELAMLGNWADAASIWQKNFKFAKESKAAQAAFNLALANEINGNFETALEWLGLAREKLPTLKHLDEYKTIIAKRLENNNLK